MAPTDALPATSTFTLVPESTSTISPGIPESTLTLAPKYATQYQYGPKLYEPIPWSVYSVSDTVWFTWERFELKPNQYYSIRVAMDVEPEQPACIHVQRQNPEDPAKNPEELLTLDCPPGGYYWSVAIASKLPEGSEHEWNEDSDVEHRNHFGIGMPHPNTPPGGSDTPPSSGTGPK
jgi:hypothetical protein